MEGGLQCSSGQPHNREYMDITESTWWFIKKIEDTKLRTVKR